MALRKIGTVISHVAGILKIDTLCQFAAPLALTINGNTYNVLLAEVDSISGSRYDLGLVCTLKTHGTQLKSDDIVYVSSTVDIIPAISIWDELDVDTTTELKAIVKTDRPTNQIRRVHYSADNPTEKVYYTYKYDDTATYTPDPGWDTAIKPDDSDGTGYVVSGVFGNGWWVRIEGFEEAEGGGGGTVVSSSVHAYAGNAHGSSIETAWKTVELDSEAFDDNNDFNAGTFTFTAPQSDTYLFSVQAISELFNHGDSWTGGTHIRLYKNGTTEIAYSKVALGVSDDDYVCANMAIVIALEYNDTIVLQIKTDGDYIDIVPGIGRTYMSVIEV